IWIFGDSYISLYPERWVYHLLQDGFDDAVLLNGYAGEPSNEAFIALSNLIKLRKPQYILWALGMNDGDSSTAVNSSWKKYYDRVVSLCSKENITPVFGTIPNVPTVNNSFKNEIIRSSGYRYIDFSKAVDPDEDGAWIGNTLSSDGVHPTADGARVLYMRALADFPELTSY
ncbi:MAG: SGNH/GDSL hydrolase family protein, partial [Oscillospiraceae bacterium]|nr:SGNH/GDSL hydrolase family protein [Oscillospiraceae bacterium]